MISHQSPMHNGGAPMNSMSGPGGINIPQSQGGPMPGGPMVSVNAPMPGGPQYSSPPMGAAHPTAGLPPNMNAAGGKFVMMIRDCIEFINFRSAVMNPSSFFVQSD